MNYLSVGDMARTWQFRRHEAQLQETLSSLSNSVTTGLQSDIGAAVSGDHRALTAIDSSLAKLDVYSQIRASASIYAASMQTSLQSVQTAAQAAAETLLGVTSVSVTTDRTEAFAQAASALETVVSSLNITAGGRYVFSGAASDAAPLASATEMLDAVASEVSGLTSAEDIAAAVGAWFDAAAGEGGWLDVAYAGSEEGVTNMRISSTATIGIPVTAADSSIRDTMQGLALAALAARGDIAADSELEQKIATLAAEKILSADVLLTQAQARIGVAEAQIEAAETQSETEKTALSTARLALIGTDAYETATALTAVEAQIETLYTLTSRLAGLSLTEYL